MTESSKDHEWKGKKMEREKKISVTVLENEILNLMPKYHSTNYILYNRELNNYCFG